MKQMLKYILTIVMENVKIAENKHGIILALNSGLIVITVGFFSSAEIIVVILNFFVTFFCAVSILFCFLGLFARNVGFERNKQCKKNINLLYFKDIVNFSEGDYLKCIIINYNFPSDYLIDGFDIDLARQIIANSKVALKKYKMFNKSVFSLALALTFAIVLMALVGFIQ